MSKYEVIVAGGGHNGLVVAGYLAKAGVKVLVVEAKPYVGGGTLTREVAAPGFKGDMASIGHVFIQPNPILKNDELQLKSQYGLEYIYPEGQFAGVFPDDRFICFYRDVDRTCESFAKFSEKDADAYHKFYDWSHQQLDMLLAGLYSPPPSFGTLNSMLETSPNGREMMRTMYLSAHDAAKEWFEDDHIINFLDRFASENMMDPRVDGSAMNLLLFSPIGHDYGMGLCKGGSGALADALVRSIVDRGGEIRTSSKVKQFKVSGGKAVGVILDSGEEILASKAVVTNFNIVQLDSTTLGTPDLPDEYIYNLERVRLPQFQAFDQSYALHEAPRYKAGKEVDECFGVEFLPDTEAAMNDLWDGFRNGIPNYETATAATCTLWDPSRAPEGKHTLWLYQYNPYNLQGGAQRWDEIREQVADNILKHYSSRVYNMSIENIIGRWICSPLDFERNNLSWYQGNFNHIGSQISHSFGMRPFAAVSNYRLPVEGLYICGPSTHPGPGVIGGGRAAVQVVLDDLGIDFDDVVK